MDQVPLSFRIICGNRLLDALETYLLLIFLAEQVDDVLVHVLVLPALLGHPSHEYPVVDRHFLIVQWSLFLLDDFLVTKLLLLFWAFPLVIAQF